MTERERETRVLRKHVLILDCGEPEGVGVSVVVAGALAVALDEGSAAELLQTGAGGGQSLAKTRRTRTSVLHARTSKQSVHLVIQQTLLSRATDSKYSKYRDIPPPPRQVG